MKQGELIQYNQNGVNELYHDAYERVIDYLDESPVMKAINGETLDIMLRVMCCQIALIDEMIE